MTTTTPDSEPSISTEKGRTLVRVHAAEHVPYDIFALDCFWCSSELRRLIEADSKLKVRVLPLLMSK